MVSASASYLAAPGSVLDLETGYPDRDCFGFPPSREMPVSTLNYATTTFVSFQIRYLLLILLFNTV